MYGQAVNENKLPDGTVWSRDWGPLQVNDYYHEKAMRDRGLDIRNEIDSLQYGMELMYKEGTTPWRASRHCWSASGT